MQQVWSAGILLECRRRLALWWRSKLTSSADEVMCSSAKQINAYSKKKLVADALLGFAVVPLSELKHNGLTEVSVSLACMASLQVPR